MLRRFGEGIGVSGCLSEGVWLLWGDARFGEAAAGLGSDCTGN